MSCLVLAFAALAPNLHADGVSYTAIPVDTDTKTGALVCPADLVKAMTSAVGIQNPNEAKANFFEYTSAGLIDFTLTAPGLHTNARLTLPSGAGCFIMTSSRK